MKNAAQTRGVFFWGWGSAVHEFDLAFDDGAGGDGELAGEDAAGDFAGGGDAAGMGGENFAEDTAGDDDVAGDEVAADAGFGADDDFAGGDGAWGIEVVFDEDVFDVDLGEALGTADDEGAARGVEGVATVDAAALGDIARGGGGRGIGLDLFTGARGDRGEFVEGEANGAPLGGGDGQGFEGLSEEAEHARTSGVERVVRAAPLLVQWTLITRGARVWRVCWTA